MTGEGITFATVAERFGWNLRIARRKAGLSQRELAERMGRSQRRVAEWESGKLCPRINSVVLLAEALKIDPGVLLRETRGLAS
ncbi:MAG: helix-turn-helix domain-containing protein [Actinomycetota bacterium]|nr:helix-turn-helix domain-containing protein [Actinomycetota bacterium]